MRQHQGAAALAEKGQEYRVKHTAHFQAKITAAREALAVVQYLAGAAFAQELEVLANTTVTDHQWRTFLDRSVPSTTARATSSRGAPGPSRLASAASSSTSTGRTTGQLRGPGPHSVFCRRQTPGLITTSRGASRQERNLLNAVSGATANTDHAAALLLGKVLDG